MLCLLPAGAVQIDSRTLVESTDESWLPIQTDGWRRETYRTQERDRSSDEGQHSCVWEYTKQDRVALVSVDFPFLGWHELTRCYTSHGWTEVARVVHDDQQPGGEGGPVVEVRLRKRNGDVGFLLFCMYDGAGNPVVPRSSHWSGVRAKLARNPLFSFLASNDTAISTDQVTLQVQQFVVTSSPLDEAERQEARQLYRRLRQSIRKRCLIHSEENGT